MTIQTNYFALLKSCVFDGDNVTWIDRLHDYATPSSASCVRGQVKVGNTRDSHIDSVGSDISFPFRSLATVSSISFLSNKTYVDHLSVCRSISEELKFIRSECLQIPLIVP